MDHATIAAARLGDRSAQAALLRELQDVWFRFCLSMLRDHDQALEAVQETALRFLQHLPAFRGQSELRTWSVGIALNVVRELRRTRRHSELPDADDTGCSDGNDDAAPDLLAEREEAAGEVRYLLAGLPDRQREAIVLRFFEEMSVEQTAQVMKCAAGTVKATVHQALRALRGKLMMLL